MARCGTDRPRVGGGALPLGADRGGGFRRPGRRLGTNFVVLRVVGAVVLVYLGARTWWSVWRAHQATSGAGVAVCDRRAPRWWRRFSEGAMVQLANPKAAVFMMVFYPQFVPAHRPLFVTTARLAVVQVLIETTLYLALAGCIGRARNWLTRPAARRRWDVISGSVLIGFGVRIAATSR